MKTFLRLIPWGDIVIVTLTMCLMKYAVIAPVYKYYSLSVSLQNLGFFFLLLSVISTLVAANIINDYFDRKKDMINRPDKVVIGFSIKRRSAILLDIVFSLIGISSGIIVVVIVGKPCWSLFVVFSVVLLWWYSVSLRQKFLVGNLLVAFYTCLIPFLVGLTEYYAFENTIEIWNYQSIHAVKLCTQTIIGFSIFAFIYGLMREIIKDCENYKGDLQTEIRSIPIVLGKETTNYLISFIALGAISLVLLFWHKYFINIHFIKFYNFATIYIYCFIVFPTLIIAIYALLGTRKRKYENLGKITKFIMFFGVMFSLFFCI